MAARDRLAGCYACGAVSGHHEHDIDCPNGPGSASVDNGTEED